MNLTSMIAFWEECIQNAFAAFWEECIQNAFRNAFSAAKTKNQETKIPPGLLNKSWNFRTKTKNPRTKIPKTPEQILDLRS